MIKNAIFYRVTSDELKFGTVADALAKNKFTPCGPTQQLSSGWIPARDEAEGELLESVGGQWIAKLGTETKKVPGAVLARAVEERVKEIEAATGRKPGKKEKRDIKEEVLLTLLPAAFPSFGATLVWLDPKARVLVIGSASQSKADAVVTALVQAVEGLAIQPMNAEMSPTAAMSEWLLSKEAPANFSVDRECELKASDESKAVVRYGSHPLDIEEVSQHVQSGLLPTRLALTWTSRVSFVLTKSLGIKKIAFLDVVFESIKGDSGFDADVIIMTSELSLLIPDLMLALGGEVIPAP